MMSDGEDSHAQALVLYLMELQLSLGDTYRCQSPQKVILSLRTQTQDKKDIVVFFFYFYYLLLFTFLLLITITFITIRLFFITLCFKE